MPLSLPSVERAKRVSRALANPSYFGELYVRPFDQNWVEPLPVFAAEMLAFALRERRGVVILPPEFLKTTILSQVFPLWLTFRATCTDKLLRGMLLSEEEGMSINNLGVVSWHILNNDLLLADFADSRGRPLVYPDPQENVWRDDSIIVARRGVSKDATWQAKGLDSKGVQGRRLDWLLGDDVITPQSAFSPAKREKALRDWDMQFTTRVLGKGHAIVAGNFNDPHDLVSTLSRRSMYAVYSRPAIHKPDAPEVAADPNDADSVLLWPENWTRARLLREKEEKPNTFGRIFLLNASSETGRYLDTRWVELIDPDDTPLPYCRYYIALDGAPGSEEPDPDFFTLTVGALSAHNLDVIESFAIRAKVAEQVELVAIIHDTFQRMGDGVVAIGGAKVAMDRYMHGAITMHRPDLEAKLVPISVPGAKEERLEALGPYAKLKWLRVWEPVWTKRTSNDTDRFQEMTLHEEWREFPTGRHDDRLDGLDVLIRTAREFGSAGPVQYDLEVQTA